MDGHTVTPSDATRHRRHIFLYHPDERPDDVTVRRVRIGQL